MDRLMSTRPSSVSALIFSYTKVAETYDVFHRLKEILDQL